MSNPNPKGFTESEDRGPYIHVAVGVCIALASVGVLARLACRRMMRQSLNLSDYFIIAGWCAAVGECTTIFMSVHFGFGKHTVFASNEDLETFLKIFFAAEMFYVLTITLTKISILLFYRSIFPGKEFALATNIIGAVVLAWAVGCILGSIFSCIPVQGFWNLSLKAKCIDSTKFFIGNAIPNMITDACILLLPVRRVWQLQLSNQRKYVVSGMFLLGGFVIVASILRLVLLFDEDLEDPLWGYVNAFTWSNIEGDIAVLSACLPTLKPLFQKLWNGGLVTIGSKKNTGKASGYSNMKNNKYSGGEELASLPKSALQEHSISTEASHDAAYHGNKSNMRGISVQREFSTTSIDAEP